MNSSFKQIIILSLIVAILATSCGNNPNAALIDLDASLANESGYYFAEVSDDIVPDPVSLEMETISLELDTDLDDVAETSVVNYHYGVSTSDTNGATSFYDPSAEATIPIFVIDEQSEPLSGIEVHFYSSDESILISFVDPAGQYSISPIVLEADSFAMNSSFDDHLGFLSRLLLPEPAFAAPARLITAALIVIATIVITAATAYFAYEAYVDILVSPLIVQETAGFGPYLCTTAERIGAEISIGVTGLGLLISGGGSNIVRLLLEGAKVGTAEIAEWIAVETLDEPVLMRAYPISNTKLSMMAGNSYDEVNATFSSGSALRWIFDRVGTCAEVPDLVDVDIRTARTMLEDRGIKWAEEYVSMNGEVLETPAEPRGAVIAQAIPPTLPTTGLARQLSGIVASPNLLAVGDWPDLMTTLHLTVEIDPLLEVSFEATKLEVYPGECSELVWSASGPEVFQVTVSGDAHNPSGIMSVCPVESTVYELQILDNQGAQLGNIWKVEISVVPGSFSEDVADSPEQPTTESSTDCPYQELVGDWEGERHYDDSGRIHPVEFEIILEEDCNLYLDLRWYHTYVETWYDEPYSGLIADSGNLRLREDCDCVDDGVDWANWINAEYSIDYIEGVWGGEMWSYPGTSPAGMFWAEKISTKVPIHNADPPFQSLGELTCQELGEYEWQWNGAGSGEYETYEPINGGTRPMIFAWDVIEACPYFELPPMWSDD